MKNKDLLETQEHIDTLTIFTMLVRCPRSAPPEGACPFAMFRDKYSLDEKFRLAESFSGEQRREMMAFHSRCLAKAFAREMSDN